MKQRNLLQYSKLPTFLHTIEIIVPSMSSARQTEVIQGSMRFIGAWEIRLEADRLICCAVPIGNLLNHCEWNPKRCGIFFMRKRNLNQLVVLLQVLIRC